MHRPPHVGTRRAAILAALAVLSSAAKADVVVSGLEDTLRFNVESLMRLDEQACDVPQRRIEAEFDDAHQVIHTALEAFGYYAPEIESELRFAADCWHASFDVSPGERVLLRNVDIEIGGAASTDTAFRALVDGAPLAPMLPLMHGEYDALKQALRTLSIERGYRDAQIVESMIDIYPDQLVADVRIVFDSGARYRFGEIELIQDVISAELLSGYIDARRGDLYDSRRLADARLELINSGYFSSVSIEPGVPDRAAGEIPVVIRMAPASRAQANYGFGFSTDTGPRFRFGRTIRRLNTNGHQININGLLSPVVVEGSANYRMPYGDPRSEWVIFDVGAIREETDTATSRSLQVGARRVVIHGERWTRTDALSHLLEDFDVASQSGRARLLMPGVEWVRLDADDPIRPDQGSRMRFLLRGASDSLGSNTSFAQVIVSTKWIWPLPRASRLLVRGQAGRIWYDVFTDLPPSVRFFAGGDDNVRGYAFQSLGPTNELGEVIGGSNLFIGSVEIEKSIKPAWSVALFADTGNAFSSSHADLHSSVGIGARWQSPLGPVRIDVAEPLDGVDLDTRLHISLGPDL